VTVELQVLAVRLPALVVWRALVGVVAAELAVRAEVLASAVMAVRAVLPPTLQSWARLAQRTQNVVSD
jgi:hypothetical protein